MSISLIIALIAIGVILILLEVFVFSGTLITGLIGLLIIGWAIGLTYSSLGVVTGNLVLLSTLGISLLLIFAIFYFLGKRKVGLQKELKGRVNTVKEDTIEIGDQGEAFSDLKLIGKAIFNNQLFEVQSTGEFIDSGAKIVVKRINGGSIFVELSK